MSRSNVTITSSGCNLKCTSLTENGVSIGNPINIDSSYNLEVSNQLYEDSSTQISTDSSKNLHVGVLIEGDLSNYEGFIDTCIDSVSLYSRNSSSTGLGTLVTNYSIEEPFTESSYNSDGSCYRLLVKLISTETFANVSGTLISNSYIHLITSSVNTIVPSTGNSYKIVYFDFYFTSSFADNNSVVLQSSISASYDNGNKNITSTNGSISITNEYVAPALTNEILGIFYRSNNGIENVSSTGSKKAYTQSALTTLGYGYVAVIGAISDYGDELPAESHLFDNSAGFTCETFSYGIVKTSLVTAANSLVTYAADNTNQSYPYKYFVLFGVPAVSAALTETTFLVDGPFNDSTLYFPWVVNASSSYFD